MRRIWPRPVVPLAVAELALATVPPAHATNTMRLAGYGTEAMGRADAGIAVSDRALGLQFKPAGISHLQGDHFGADLQILMPKLRLRNYQGSPIANGVDGKDRKFSMPSVACVRGAKDSPWTRRIGLVSQGGVGATCVADAVNDNLSFGLSANVGWSADVFREPVLGGTYG